jgi:formate hydrogenlyase subunit 6/NADH:ubiquinone oxidoreductase subunit I
MAKTWYPVIDYLTCTECGTCIEHCALKNTLCMILQKLRPLWCQSRKVA